MGIENKGPGGVSNSYGQRTSKTPSRISEANLKHPYYDGFNTSPESGAGITVYPSGDTSGLADTIAMQSAIAQGLPLVLMGGATYWTDEKLTLPSGAILRFGNGARIKRRNSFEATLDITSGSASATISGIGENIVRRYQCLSGPGLSRPCRIEAIVGSTVTLNRPATQTGSVSVTVHPGHNILFARNVGGIIVHAPEGVGYLDGNLEASCPWINASHDAEGSGFRFEGCFDWFMDNIKTMDNSYHGGFFTSTPTSPGALNVRIGYLEAENNGVRGLHGRAEGGAGHPGINDVEVDTLVLRSNGRLYLNHAMPYDVSNGGCFLQVAGVRRTNIKTLRAYNEYGVSYQALGNDAGTAGFDSENCSVGTALFHNCGYGASFGRGIKSHATNILHITADRRASSTGFGNNIGTIAELSRPSLEADWLEYFMVVGTVTLPSAWTTAQIAEISAGDHIMLDVSTGAADEGCGVVSVDPVAKTALVYSLIDPLGIGTDNSAGLVTSTTPAGAGAITLNGAQTSAGVSNYSGARKLNITSTGNISNRTFTITGTAWDGSVYIETVTGPNNTTVQTNRLFKTVSAISISGAAAASITIGTCIARPFTVTQANKGGMWRASRGAGIEFTNNVATTAAGDVERIHFGEVLLEGIGAYGVLARNTSARATLIGYRDVTFGKLTIKETRFGIRLNNFRDANFHQLVLDTVGIGFGSDNWPIVEEANTRGTRVGTFTHKHDATKFTCNSEVLKVLSTSQDYVCGFYKSDTAATVHARFDGAGCVLTKPMNYTSGAALVVGAAILGSGSPVAWLPA